MRVLYYSLSVVIVDQISKLFVKGFSIPFLNINFEGMSYGSSLEVIGNFFKITFVENPGMAFGIDVSDGSKLFLSLFSLIASIGLLIYLFKIKDEKFLFRLSIALILGGAVGNLIDRTFYGMIYGYAPIFYGKVVDFFNVEFFDFTIFGRTYQRWPVFNIADSAVTVGVLIIVLFNSKIQKENKLSDKSKPAPEAELNTTTINSEKGSIINNVEGEPLQELD